MEKLIKFLISIPFSVGSTILHAWVVTKLWMWFIVPTFGLNELSMPIAIGLSCLFSVFFPLGAINYKEEGERPVGEMIGISVAKSVASLSIGFITKQFI